jgi:deferrochelatase/peroxidase EfeB
MQDLDQSPSPQVPGGSRFSRRNFLKAGAAGGFALGAASLIGGCSSDEGQAEAEPLRQYVDFYGAHQAGIAALPAPELGLMAAFKVVAPDRDALREMLIDLTDEVQGLMAGRPPQQRDPAYPPTDSGLLGAEPKADNLSIVISVGASLFDDRYGLSEKKPRELVAMPFLANDRLDPRRTHGDLLMNISASHPDTIQFALRQLMRRRRRDLVLHWVLDGYTRGSSPHDGSEGSPRNLLGFRDGTANLDAAETGVMDHYVWVHDDDGEPAWATGGSYQAVRVIRMFVEAWDRAPLSEQEAIIGRHKLSGAPLGQDHEADLPDYADDPDGKVVPLDSHIRLANPRTADTQESLIFRRGFSYTRGFDDAGRLDTGLAFVSYQRSLERGFLAVQSRLSGEPLEEYTLTEGGGFFFVLPGVTEANQYLGQGLFA